MSKVGRVILPLVMSLMSISANAFWFDIPTQEETLSNHGSVEEIQAALDPRSIDIFVWNIYKGGFIGWNIDLAKFTKDKDVVILQEGILNNAMREEFDASKKLQYTFATSFVFKSTGHETGVVTGAVVPPKSVEYQRSEGRELAGFTPKMILIKKFALAGMTKELMTINIHALNSVTWKKMAVQVIKALKVAEEHDGPVVFAGDFNTWSRKKEAFVMRAMERAGFKNVEFPNGNDRMEVFGHYLDYIFIRGLEATNARVITEATGSDHKPLAATLRVIFDK